MNGTRPKIPASHGSGQFRRDQFRRFGANVVIEPGVLVFHPETISIGDGVYVGHNAILKGYHRNAMVLGDGCWIGQGCFFHSAGGLTVEEAVGVGPMVKVLTSEHVADRLELPVLHSPLRFAAVRLRRGCDVGVGAVILPGVTVGEGAIVGAGSVVTGDVPDFEVWAGNPARRLRRR